MVERDVVKEHEVQAARRLQRETSPERITWDRPAPVRTRTPWPMPRSQMSTT